MTIQRSDITGLVLAGGRAMRMGGVDKGLQLYQGRALALHAAQRLGAQVGLLAINANRYLDDYRAFGFPVWPDQSREADAPDGWAKDDTAQALWSGPLAGMRVGLERCSTTWLATVPCDSPLFPPDLVQRLARVAIERGADAAVAALSGGPIADGEAKGGVLAPPSLQPVFSLLHVRLGRPLADYLGQGGRKVGTWLEAQRCAVVVFDDAAAFANANTHAELQALEVQSHAC